jgi:hypothetical protein
MVEKVDVVRRGKVRRAKLYYLRGLTGKSARIVEATNARAKRMNEAARGVAAASGPTNWPRRKPRAPTSRPPNKRLKPNARDGNQRRCGAAFSWRYLLTAPMIGP